MYRCVSDLLDVVELRTVEPLFVGKLYCYVVVADELHPNAHAPRAEMILLCVAFMIVVEPCH